MSSDFWINLILAMFVFTFALAFVNRSKINAIRSFMASRLRRKTRVKLEAISPIISSSLSVGETELFPMFRIRADLEALCVKADVLFDVEHRALADFLAELSYVISKFKSGSGTTEQIESLTLSCQRAINELSEFER